MTKKAILKYLITVKRTKAYMLVAAILNCIGALFVLVMQDTVFGIIGLILSCVLLVCYFLVTNGLSAGYLLATAIFAFNALGSFVVLRSYICFVLMGICFSVVLMVLFLSGYLALRNLPNYVDINATVKAFKAAKKQAKASKRNTHKADKPAVKNSEPQLEIYYKD